MNPPRIQSPQSEIPTVPSPPIIGHFLPLATDSRQFLTTQYLQHGPVFQVPVMGRRMLVLAGPAANALAKSEDGQLFASGDIWKPIQKVFDMDMPSMIALDGPRHALLRSGLRAGYVGSSLYAQMAKLIDSQREILETWPQGTPFAVFPQVKRLVSSLLGYMATNEKPDAIMDEMIYFFKAMIQIHIQRLRPGFLQYLPRYTRSRAAVLGMARRIWEERADHDIVAGDENFVDVVRKFQQAHPDLMTEKDAIAAINGPFIAGLDTAASVTSCMLFHMLRDPALKAAVQREADQVCRQGLPNRQSLRQMVQTRYAAMETLRMYPPAPLLYRVTVADFEFEGFQIAQGQACMIAHTVTHYLPQFFPEPERFDVTRFAPPRAEHTQPHAYAPYGLGPHTCLGASTADLLYLIIAAVLFHHYELELARPDMELKLVMDPLIGPSDDFKAILRPRRARPATAPGPAA